MSLAAGTSATVSFSVSGSDLSLVDTDGGRWIVEGDYTVVFTNGAHEVLQTSLQIHDGCLCKLLKYFFHVDSVLFSNNK